jgi:hypothetical protein
MGSLIGSKNDQFVKETRVLPPLWPTFQPSSAVWKLLGPLRYWYPLLKFRFVTGVEPQETTKKASELKRSVRGRSFMV